MNLTTPTLPFYRLLLLIVAGCFYVAPCQAQQDLPDAAADSSMHKNTIALNVFGLVVGGADLAYSYMVTPTSAIRINAGVYYDPNATLYEAAEDMIGWRADIQYRIFNKPLTRRNMPAYMGPFIQWKQIAVRAEDDFTSTDFTRIRTLSASALSVGLIGGVKTMISQKLSLDFFIGMGYQAAIDTEGTPVVHSFVNPYRSAPFFRTGLFLGFGL